jgi:LETM1 and EF-hand domain-containing protein 1, mitochondrial
VEEFKQFTLKETPQSSIRLGTQVDKMIENIESQLKKYDIEKTTRGEIDSSTVQPQAHISIQDLEKTLRVIRDHPNDERISKIVARLDSDNDGLVAVNEILKLAEKYESEGKKVVGTDSTKRP